MRVSRFAHSVRPSGASSEVTARPIRGPRGLLVRPTMLRVRGGLEEEAAGRRAGSWSRAGGRGLLGLRSDKHQQQHRAGRYAWQSQMQAGAQLSANPAC